MTFTEFLQKLDHVKDLLTQHNIDRDEIQVKIYGQNGDPYQMILKKEGDNGFVRITVNL